MNCQKCDVYRKRLHRCVTCNAGLCGGCSFHSRAGRVCPGECHAAAIAFHDGAAACKRGDVAIIANPHAEESAEWYAWNRGWLSEACDCARAHLGHLGSPVQS